MLRLQEYRYVRPSGLEEALDLLVEHPGEAMPISGGTDLVPNMKHRLFTPRLLVGLKRVQELRGIEVRDGWLRVGAAETLSAVAADPLVRLHAPSLAAAAGLVAGPQLRNMGTIGGNICLDTRCTYYNQTYFWRSSLGFCLKKDGDTCHVTKVGKKCVAAHSADTPPALMTLGAVVELASQAGRRELPVEDFFVADGIWNTVRLPDELLVAVKVPLNGARRTAFRKVRQRGAIDFPLLNVAVAVDMEGDEVRDMRLVVSALGSRPRFVAGLDRVAAGRRLDDETIDAVAQRAFQQSQPLTNIIVDVEWRRAMVPVEVKRALRELR